jgi:hypothetical protein
MELYKNHIPIGSIYYMLSYAFNDLQEQNVVSVKPEKFENIHQLIAEIIIRGISYQLKRDYFAIMKVARKSWLFSEVKLIFPIP